MFVVVVDADAAHHARVVLLLLGDGVVGRAVLAQVLRQLAIE
jgi:hypothetical protein